MLSVFLLLIILIVLTLSIKILFKYSSEASLFLVICSITVLIAIAALLGIIQITIYFVYLLVIVGLVFISIHLIKNKSKTKEILADLFSPGMVVFLISCIIYYVVIYDKLLIHDDEAGSWGKQVLYMFKTNTYKSFSGHGHMLGFFTLFTLKVVGYSEAIFFFSLWIVKWSALLLAMREIKWDKWYIALIFSVGCLGILNILPNIEPVYYMDIPLGVLAGSLCVSWSIKKPVIKDYVWLFLGLIILVNLKDELGAVISMLTVMYCIAVNLINHFKKDKQERKIKKINITLNSMLVLVVLFFAMNSYSIKLLLGKVINSVSNVYLFSALGFLIGLILLIVLFRKKIISFIVKYKKAIFIFVVFIIIASLLSLYYIRNSKNSINNWINVQTMINRLWNDIYYGKPAFVLVVLSIMFTTIIGLFVVNKEHMKSYIIESYMIILMIPIYSSFLLVGFLIGTDGLFDHFLNSLARYCAPIILLASIWIFAKTLRMEKKYRFKNVNIIAGLLLGVLFFSQIPTVGTVALSNLEYERKAFTYIVRPEAKKHADFIKEYVDDEKLLILCSTDTSPWDPFTAALWITYELTPLKASKTILTGDKDYVYTRLNCELTYDELYDYIANGGYKYVYFYTKNEFIEKKYAGIMEEREEKVGVLYKVTPDNETLLTFVDSMK